MWIDGILYALIALFGFLQIYFSSDDSVKYVDPVTLYWVKCGIGACAAVTASLKMFRSTAFADHLACESDKIKL